MPANNADENFKRKLILDINAGIYKLVLKDTDNLEIWKTFAMIQKADGSMVDHYYACIHCKKVCKAAGKGASNMYLHITKCPMNISDKNSMESEPEETKTEIHYKLKTGVYKMVLKESNNIAIWEKYAMVSKADGSILDGYYCCIKCLKVFRVYNIYLSSLYRHVKSCAKNSIKLQQNPQQEMENNIKRKIRKNLQKRTKTKYNLKTDNEDEPIHHGSHELEDGTDTASDDELLEEKKNHPMPINPIWQTFELSLTDECKEVLSCRQCKMVLECDYTSKSRVEVHKCPNANKRNSRNRLTEMPSQRDVEEKIKSEIGNKVKAGILKLAKNHTNKRLVWKVFDLIRSTNGRIVENYACCSICENILKSSFAKPALLRNHNCYIQFVRETKVEVDGYNSNTILEKETTEDIGKEISKNRKSTTKSEENDSKAAEMDTLTDDSTEDTNSSLPEQMNVYNEANSIQDIDKYCSYDDNDPIWLRFKLISLDDGSNSGERVVSCRHCKMILKYNVATKVQLDQHKCFPNAYIDNPKPIREKDVENTMKIEVDDDSYSICVKEEYNYGNLREHFPNETLLQTTENDEVYQKLVEACNDDTDSNEAREMLNVIYIKNETEVREDSKTNADDAGTQTEDTFSENIRYADKKVEKGNGCAEFENATVTEMLNTSEGIELNERHASRGLEQDNTITASGSKELLEVEKHSSILANPVWQIFALVFTNEGKPELSCRLCKNVLECDYKSKLYVKEHKCLSADKRNSIKVMPSQRDIEEKIKSEIYNNINAGIFTLTKNIINRSLSWQVFHLITTKNGTRVADYTFCSICKKVLKCHLMKIEGLRPHRCYQQFLRLRKDELKGNNSLASSKEQNEKDVENKIKSGVYKMEHSKVTTNPIWTQFSLISKSDGTLIKEMVCCRLCKVVLKCNDQNSEEYLQQHKCLQLEESSENRKNISKLTEKELRTEMDKRKSEIKSNITAGVYTLHMNPDGKSLAWKIFARIKAADDTLIDDYVFCTKCKHISTYDGHRTGNLTRHPCLNKSSLRRKPSALNNDVELEWETANKRSTTNVCEVEEENETKTPSTEQMGENSRTDFRKFTTKSVEIDKRKLEIKSNISAGVYTLRMNPDGKSLAWTIFARIIDADDTLIEDYVICTKCKQISSYDRHRTTNLTRHPCLNKSRLCNEASVLKTENHNKIATDASNMYLHINKCPKKITAKSSKESEPEETKTEIHNKLKTGVYKMVLKESNNIAIWEKFAMVSKADGSILDGYYCCIKCLKLFRVYNIYLSSLYRHVKSCEIELQQNPQQEMENNIKRKIRNNLQKRTKTKSNTKTRNEEEHIQHGSHELKDGTDTTEMDTLTDNSKEDTNSSLNVYNEAKSIQNIDEHCSYDSKWQRFKLISRDDGSTAGGATVSCRQCNMIIKYNSTTKDQLEQHQCFPKAHIDDPRPIRKKAMENTVKNEIDDSYSFCCVKEEYNYSNSPNQSEFTLQRISSNETLQTTVNDKEYQRLVGTCSDTYSKEAREWSNATYIKKEMEAIEDIKSNIDIEDQTEVETCSENTQQTVPEKLNTSEGIEACEVDSDEWQENDISTASDDDERLQVDKGSTPSNPIWEIFALVLRDEGKPELSCRLCKMVLEYNYKSKNYVKEHRCLSADKRNSLKMIPSQRDIEEKIKSEINKNINAGIFKLTKNKSKKSLAWQVFDFITTKNGSKVVDYTFCTICKKVLKCYLMKMGSLCTHKCYIQFARLRKGKMDDNNSFAAWEEETTAEYEKDVENKINLGIYKMKHSKVTTNPIWTQFSLISKSDGTLIKEMVCCRLCKAVLKYSGQSSEDNLQQHKCLTLEESSRTRKYTTKLVEKELRTEMDNRKLEIISNISAGVYSLFINPDGKSVAWKIFARIKDADDTLIEDYVFCTKCKQISTYDGHRTGNLTRHPCVKNPSRRKEPSALSTETANKKRSMNVNKNDSVCRTKRPRMVDNDSNEDENIPNNDDELLHAATNDPIWLRFELFTMDDGSTVDRVVSCRQCKIILKYDGTTKLQLEQHKCFSKASLPTNAKTIEKEINEIDNCYSICVKEEYILD